MADGFTLWFASWLEKSPSNRRFFENNMSVKNGSKKYSIDDYPLDFNAWMAYRAIVDIVLSCDLACYLIFSVAYFEIPDSIGFFDLLLYVIGILLCLFNVWAKSDAHRVLGDYAWCTFSLSIFIIICRLGRFFLFIRQGAHF